ncbi:MAG: glycosyltransferase family 39 protein, partial [Anaerolineaceae bacterium]|nr:glycosyltransferase family 39 protein [Anaerolineaceae bacterium]
MKEPSVLDYFLAKIQFWKKSELDFTPYLQESRVTDLKEWDEALMDDFVRQDVNSTDSNAQKSAAEDQSVSAKSSAAVPWRILLTLFFAIAGQSVMEPPTPNFGLAIGLYVLSAAFMIWAVTRKELRLSDSPVQRQRPFGLEYKSTPMLLSVPFLLGAFLTFGNNRFNLLNLLLWLIGFALVVYGLWLPKKRAEGEADFISKVECFLRNPSIHFHIGKWELLLLVMALVGVFFKTYALAETPAEMFSDHAEKLLDVQDVLEGTTSIFFERNTGREAFQMYLTAFVSETFGTGISFMSLKLGTVLCGILILPYLYLLGKELGNRWVGLLALGFIGIAYWPNVIARVGLRFILYAFFTAPTLYYFLRGMRHSNRNDLILAGVFLGLGLHGYSSFRFVPVVIVIGVLLFLLHQRTGNSRFSASIWSLLVIALVSFVVFLPLFRYMLSNPTMFSYRMATRLGTLEREYPGSPILIFFGNYLKANLMFFWTNGNTWVHSVTNRPALDVVTAASYFIGLALLVIRYVRQRKWEDLFLLVSIPMLLMPSILSLAFPDENPSLNRTSGAMVPVILVAAMGLEAVLRGLFD